MRQQIGNRRGRWCAALAILALVAGGFPPLPAQAEETLRERIKQRMEARHGPSAETKDASRGQDVVQPGTREYALVHQGLTRKYLVHVPGNYDARKPIPLVFAFHGGGGSAWYMADDARYGLISKAEQAGFVIVFPNGYSRLSRGRAATWNAGECCGEARDRDMDDVGFVRAVLEQVEGRINVDRARIFATGMSNGGMLSHRLACEMADVFSAVAAVAGTDNTRQCAPSRPIAVLHLHATDDDHVLFNGGAGENAFHDASKVTSFVSVPDTIARWTSRNQCNTPPVRTLSRPGAYCDTYSGCAGGVHVQLCVTDTGGHSWPGAETVRRRKAPAAKALSANDVIWEFFTANVR